MPDREYRRVVNQGAYGTIPTGDRVFAEAVRRLLLRVVSMIEDRYDLRPVNPERQTVQQR